METTENQRLKIFITDKNLTQVQLAHMLEVEPATVNGMLKGKSRMSINNALILKEKLGLNPLWLWEGIGEMYLKDDSNLVNQLKHENETLKNEVSFLRKQIETVNKLVERYIDIPKVKVNFSVNLLKATKNHAVQTVLPLFETTQLTLLASSGNVKVA